MNEKILFIDSGIGGISTLFETINILPSNYIYFADTKHHPYGLRSKSEITSYIDNIISKMTKKYKINIIVIACNTATGTAISFLRKKYKDIKIIGTEPAISLAEKSDAKQITVIATPMTLLQPNFLKLKNMSKKSIIELPQHDLASQIENYFNDQTMQNMLKLLKSVFNILLFSRNSALVLGCTHYSIIKSIFEKLSPNIKIFDGNNGVAKMVYNTYYSSHSKIMTKVSDDKKYNLRINGSTINFIFSSKKKLMTKHYKNVFKMLVKNQFIKCNL